MDECVCHVIVQFRYKRLGILIIYHPHAMLKQPFCLTEKHKSGDARMQMRGTNGYRCPYSRDYHVDF